jgi:TatD DNase family protein
MTRAANGFDFHCHVDLFPDPAATIAECERNRIITLAVTTTPKAWAQNRQWTTDSVYVYPAVGLHPELASQRHGEAELLEQLMPNAPFVGEIGLDGSPQHRKSWQMQKEVFVRALNAAQRLGGRVASIHSRRAAREVLDCLAEHTTPQRVLPILHWFSDAVAVARNAVDQGCYFSINHRMLASDSGVTLIRDLPTDRLLTETDAPFTETGDRKSEPQDVVATAQRLATVRGLPADEMMAILTSNAARVFAFAGVNASFEREQV